MAAAPTAPTTSATTIRFACAARVLGGVARAQGLEVPGFRSPPRAPGASRALRRGPDGSATVAVRVQGRPWLAVVADMVEGVVAANALAGAGAEAWRSAAWAAVEQAEGVVERPRGAQAQVAGAEGRPGRAAA